MTSAPLFRTSGLLPEGLYDLLPRDAEKERHAIQTLLETFSRYGYEQATPPLLEFEETLLAGSGALLGAQTFRVMDPSSRRMLGLRTDITMQIARIAETRLADAPRPLRLSYAGPVLRIGGEGPRGERTLTQAGIELIGAQGAAADAEVIAIAARALTALGVSGVAIDLNLPGLWETLLDASITTEQRVRLRKALDHKDESALRDLPPTIRDRLTALLRIGGDATAALAALRALDLPEAARARCVYAEEVVARLAHLEDVPLTLDPVESRGLAYHTGLSFTVFARGIHGELGRGGGYTHGTGGEADTRGTGLTLYLTTLLPYLPSPPRSMLVFVPHDAPEDVVATLHAEGYRTLRGLSPSIDAHAEARQLGCGGIWVAGRIEDFS